MHIFGDNNTTVLLTTAREIQTATGVNPDAHAPAWGEHVYRWLDYGDNPLYARDEVQRRRGGSCAIILRGAGARLRGERHMENLRFWYAENEARKRVRATLEYPHD
jgi:hypothetical protein